MIHLSSEITQLASRHQPMFTATINAKIKQHARLNESLVALYLSAGFLVLSGVLSGILVQFFSWCTPLALYIIFRGALNLFIGLIYLIRFAILAVNIKRAQFLLSLKEDK